MPSAQATLSGILSGAGTSPPSSAVPSGTALTFRVDGTPLGKGSTVARGLKDKAGNAIMKNGRVVVIQHDTTGQRGKTWAKAIATTALAARAGAGIRQPVESDRPVRVHARFYLARPQKHYRRQRGELVLRGDAPRYPLGKPDVDKMLRALLDPLTGVLFSDDKQVVDGHPTKHYADLVAPGVLVVVRYE